MVACGSYNTLDGLAAGAGKGNLTVFVAGGLLGGDGSAPLVLVDTLYLFGLLVAADGAGVGLDSAGNNTAVIGVLGLLCDAFQSLFTACTAEQKRTLCAAGSFFENYAAVPCMGVGPLPSLRSASKALFCDPPS